MFVCVMYTHLGINHDSFIRSARRIPQFVEDQQTYIDAYLRGREADAIRVIHSVEHAPRKVGEIGIESCDRNIGKAELSTCAERIESIV